MMFLKQKKGVKKQYYMIAELVFAAVVIIFMFYIVYSIVGDTVLEKNYVARDLALVMETIHAAPSDIEYVYPIKYNFDIKIFLSEITVEDDKGIARYWYHRDESVKQIPENFNFAFKGDKKEIRFVKTDKQLTISCSGCSQAFG